MAVEVVKSEGVSVSISFCVQEYHGRQLAEQHREHTQRTEEMERSHATQLQTLVERMATEKEAWQENITRKQETALMAKEREMRDTLRQERDKVRG